MTTTTTFLMSMKQMATSVTTATITTTMESGISVTPMTITTVFQTGLKSTMATISQVNLTTTTTLSTTTSMTTMMAMESSIPSKLEYVERIYVVTPMQLVLDGRVSGESAPLRLLSF